MQIRRIVLVGASALVLAGSGAAAASATGVLPGSGGTPGPAGACPAPPPGAHVENLEVKDGKLYLNGKLVGEAKPGEPVAVKDGKVYVGAAAEALPKPPDGKGSLVINGEGGKACGEGPLCTIEGAEE